MVHANTLSALLVTSLAVVLAACSSDAVTPATSNDAGSFAEAGADAGADANLEMPTSIPDAQTPALGAGPIDDWLAKGDYLKWACEAAPHARRAPGAHGATRICSNTLHSAHGTTAAAGEFPVGAAAVKELRASADPSSAITGYAVMYKYRAGAGGDAWYWFERTSASRIEADGPGTTGPEKTLCAACHEGAGRGGNSGHDFAFTQVQ